MRTRIRWFDLPECIDDSLSWNADQIQQISCPANIGAPTILARGMHALAQDWFRPAPTFRSDSALHTTLLK